MDTNFKQKNILGVGFKDGKNHLHVSNHSNPVFFSVKQADRGLENPPWTSVDFSRVENTWVRHQVPWDGGTKVTSDMGDASIAWINFHESKSIMNHRPDENPN